MKNNYDVYLCRERKVEEKGILTLIYEHILKMEESNKLQNIQCLTDDSVVVFKRSGTYRPKAV